MKEEALPQKMLGSDLPASGVNELRALDSRIAKLELKQDEAKLSGEAQYRELLIREVRQRMRARTVSSITCISVMFFMSYVLLHPLHGFLWEPILPAPQAVVIVMFAAPIISITTITIMLLIGAFRRFKDDDIDKMNAPAIAADLTAKSLMSS